MYSSLGNDLTFLLFHSLVCTVDTSFLANFYYSNHLNTSNWLCGPDNSLCFIALTLPHTRKFWGKKWILKKLLG